MSQDFFRCKGEGRGQSKENRKFFIITERPVSKKKSEILAKILKFLENYFKLGSDDQSVNLWCLAAQARNNKFLFINLN